MDVDIDFNKKINKFDPLNIYRTLHPTNADIFSSSAYRTFMVPKKIFNKLQRTESI